MWGKLQWVCSSNWYFISFICAFVTEVVRFVEEIKAKEMELAPLAFQLSLLKYTSEVLIGGNRLNLDTIFCKLTDTVLF